MTAGKNPPDIGILTIRKNLPDYRVMVTEENLTVYKTHMHRKEIHLITGIMYTGKST